MEGRRGIPLAILVCVLIGSGGLAFAQMDLSGEWLQQMDQDAPDRGGGPDIGDYTGTPINGADRLRAQTWSPEKWTAPEHECEPHPADYAPWGPGSLHIWSDVDPDSMKVTAWHVEFMWMQPTQTIYMDGRSAPPGYAAHTWEGFSTGRWVGDMLEVTTTQLKEGWIQRNGLARSEKAYLTEFFNRHDDNLTEVIIVHDPVYLSEPFIRGANWVLDPGYHPIPSTCIPTVEVPHPKGWVAFNLPGQYPLLHDFARRYGIPYEAALGGAQTIYPEYEKRLQHLPTPPPLPKGKY